MAGCYIQPPARFTQFSATTRLEEQSMTRFWQDLRYSARSIRHYPVYAATVILTLALTSGATTAIFSIVNAVLLRAMPYPQPERLVMLYQGIPKAMARPIGFSAPDYLAFEERATSFSSMAAFKNRDYELSGVAQPEWIPAARVSAALFETLGVSPALGRSASNILQGVELLLTRDRR